MRPKVDGARNLDALTKHLPLDCFVFFSSVAALYGTAAQANYAAANAWLDAMAHARRAAGLPATSINFGPLAEAGMSVRQNVTGRFAQRGFPAVALSDAIEAMSAAMGGNVRVGLEDSLWIGPGKLAESNAAQVRAARQVIEGLGLSVATPDEAREILALKGAAKVGF